MMLKRVSFLPRDSTQYTPSVILMCHCVFLNPQISAISWTSKSLISSSSHCEASGFCPWIYPFSSACEI